VSDVEIPYGMACGGTTARGLKMYAALAANGWREGVGAVEAAALSGLSIATAYRALDDLKHGGWITDELMPGGEE